MIAFVLAILGQLGELLTNRLTSTRAANLDKLDATISTRAAASTALSNATWTDDRAAKLDKLDTIDAAVSTNPLLDNQSAAMPSGTTPASPSASGIGASARSHLAYNLGAVYFDTAATGSLVSVINYSGKGVINFIAGGLSSSSSNRLRIVADGVPIFDRTYTTDLLIVGVGGIARGATSGDYGALAFDQIPFTTSLLVQQSAASGTMYLVAKWRPTA